MCKFGSRFSVCVSCLSLALIGTMAQHAEAQRRGRSGLRLGNVTASQVLILEDAQEELKLSDEQTAKIAIIDQAFTTDRRKMFAEVSKESGDRGRKLTEMNKQTAAKIDAVLDEPQRKRLQEILLQVNGAVALEQDEMAATLGITEDQKSKLAEVRRSNAKVRRETHAKLDGSSSQTLANKMAELHREAEKKLLEVLTDQQRKQFEQMQGAKIDLQLYKN